MGKGAVALGNNSSCIRKRVYWQTPDGIAHGFVKKENGKSFEVYNYDDGKTVAVAQKDITKVVTEEL